MAVPPVDFDLMPDVLIVTWVFLPADLSPDSLQLKVDASIRRFVAKYSSFPARLQP